MTEPAAAPIPAAALRRLLRPASVAVVGASDDPASIGGAPLALLERFGFSGEIHLVSRSRARVGARTCVGSIDELPPGVDAAILAIPRGAVPEAVDAAARRGVGGVIVFSSGYAETGGEGAAAERALAAAARARSLALAGPNCLGLINFVDAVPLTFADAQPSGDRTAPGVAILAQSGAMSMALTYAAQAQQIPVTFTVSTGNEAVLGIEDYLNLVLDDERTRAVVLLVEQIRRPAEFLALAARANAQGIALCVLHTGLSARARAASLTHTGALAGDQRVVRTVLEHAGVLLIDSLDELIDTAEVIVKCGRPARAGAAMLTDSGAAKTHAIDVAEMIGLALPELSEATRARLAAELPPFATAENPTDITAMGLNDPALYARVAAALLADEDVGTLVVAAMPGSPKQGTEQVDALVPALVAAEKPVIYTIMGGDWPLVPANVEKIRAGGIPLFRSPEAALRAANHLGRFAAASTGAPCAEPTAPDLGLQPGRTVGELEAKALLACAGIAVPAGAFAADVDAALAQAATIGYPVVLKVVAPGLVHKSDVGGVVRVETPERLPAAHAAMLAAVATAAPARRVDGVLVEAARSGGVEMILGCRRDPDWGPVLVLGLGGIWTNLVDDSVCLSASATPGEIATALAGLRGYGVLTGARGTPPCDLDALCRAAGAVAALMHANPVITEIEINPLLVGALGEGAVALDALVVT